MIVLGTPGGCLNGIPPSVDTQCSSSQSAGRSKSKLKAGPRKQLSGFGLVRKQNLLFIIKRRAPPHRHAVDPVLVHQTPKCPLP